MPDIDIDALKKAALAKVEKAQQKAQATIAKRKRDKLVYLPEPTGDPEIDSAADLDAVQKGFRARVKNEDNRFELATDSEYWCCIAAQTRAGKEDLLEQLGLLPEGDKYLTAKMLAGAINRLVESGKKIELKQEDKVPYHDKDKIDKDFAKFVQ